MEVLDTASRSVRSSIFANVMPAQVTLLTVPVTLASHEMVMITRFPVPVVASVTVNVVPVVTVFCPVFVCRSENAIN